MKSSHERTRCRPVRTRPARRPTDNVLEATPDEIESIRRELNAIEKFLAPLFGVSYNHDPESFAARRELAHVIERNFEEIVERWRAAITAIFSGSSPAHRPSRTGSPLVEDLSNALIRFADHLSDPDDIQTYVHLRRHCQEGMLSRAEPSQFNTIHIALKQIVLDAVRASVHNRERMELIRNTVVAAIDERRLMVSQFYIESREHALRLSEEKYRNSINHAPDPMYEVEPDTWTVLSANSAAENLHSEITFGSETPLVGRSFASLTPDRKAEIQRHLSSVVQNGADQMLDLQLGSRFFDVNSALIAFGEQRLIQLIFHDVTQRREMLDGLLKAERLAAVGTFAAGVAHEVNNPLASISSLVQSLLPGETDSSRKSMLHTMLSQITRISGTLKDLVNFARPSTAQRQAMDLNALVTDTLRLVSYNKRFRGIALEPELAPDLAAAYGDANEIQQVLINLMFNAADATQCENAAIRVVTLNEPSAGNGERPRKVKVRVVDNGIGIPREHLERIFDPFFTTKPPGAGTGLGLSLCQRIILGNRGTIKVESEVGKGTAVTICLPSVEADAEERRASA